MAEQRQSLVSAETLAGEGRGRERGIDGEVSNGGAANPSYGEF